MKKHIRMVAVVALVVCLANGIANFAMAGDMEDYSDDSPITLRYVDVMETSATIAIDNRTGKITSKMLTVSRNSTDTLEVTMILQKLVEGAWLSEKTWADSNTHAISMTKYYYVLDAGTYRVCAITDVYDKSGNLVESVTVTSAEKDYDG